MTKAYAMISAVCLQKLLTHQTWWHTPLIPAEAGRALSWRPAWTTSEFQDSHSYKERLASKKEPQTPKSNEYTKTQQNKKLILFAQCFYTVRIPLPCWKAFLLSTNQGNLCACNLHKEQGKMAKQTKRCRFLNGYF